MPAKPKPTTAEIAARAEWLKGRLDAMPSFHDPEDTFQEGFARRRDYRTAQALLEQALVTATPFPASISHHGGTLHLQMAGLSVTCTHGLVGACRNWLSRAAAVIATAGAA